MNGIATVSVIGKYKKLTKRMVLSSCSRSVLREKMPSLMCEPIVLESASSDSVRPESWSLMYSASSWPVGGRDQRK